MAEHSKFFDSLNPLDPDKVYTADEFIDYFEKLITTGIMKGEANMLKVETSGSNMNTTVDTGAAYLNGRLYENDAKLSLIHEVEALGKSRIDRVVVRLVLDVDARYIKAFVKKGVAGASPIAPPLERTGDIYEISLAQVKVIGGQTYINVADVEDERGIDVICPWAGSKILPNFNDAALEQLVNDVDTLIETKADKTAGSWIDAVLAVGWSNDNTNEKLRYFKDGFGIVHLLGTIKGTTPGIFTLPVGFRPLEPCYFKAIVYSGDIVGGYTFKGIAQIRVDTSGNVATNVIYSNNDIFIIDAYFKSR